MAERQHDLLCARQDREVFSQVEEYLAREYEKESGLTVLPRRRRGRGINPVAAMGPKQQQLPRSGVACTIDVFAAEVGWSDNYVRRWFQAHPADTSVSGHGEQMHLGPYRSIRLSPAAREHFKAAHTP